MKRFLANRGANLVLAASFGIAVYMIAFFELRTPSEPLEQPNTGAALNLPTLSVATESQFQAVFSSSMFGQKTETTADHPGISALGTITTPQGQLAVVRVQGELAPVTLAVGQTFQEWTLQGMDTDGILLTSAYQELRIPFKTNKSSPSLDSAATLDGSDNIVDSVMDILKATRDDN